MTTNLIPASRELALAGPIGSLDSYVTAVSSIPVLDREQEQKLARRFRDDSDLDAARELVLSNLRFVVHIARGYSGYGLNMGDLVQEGNIGLMKAVKRFDPDVGVRLVSFAVHWIRAEIHEFVLRNWRVVKVATTKAQRKLFFNLRKAKKRLGWLGQEETETVARELGVSAREVTEMEQRLAARDLSFDPVPTAGDDDDGYGPATYLPGLDADPSIAVANADWEENSRDELMQAIAELDERSQDIVQSRWLDDKKVTLQTLAARYGVSAERIRQIESQSMKKLRGLIAI